MRRFHIAVIAASLLVGDALFGQDTLVGTWQGGLTVSDDANVVVQFIIEQDASGSYSAVLNAPEEPNLRNIPVTSFRLEEGHMTLEVDAVSGVYEGDWREGAIQGTWTQGETSFPLNLSPYAEPVLTEEMADQLLGSWHGMLRPPTMPDGLNVVMIFQTSDEGELAAFMDIPDLSVRGLVLELTPNGDTLTMKEPVRKIEYIARFDGEKLTGEFTEGNAGPFPLQLQKGELTKETGLKLSAELIVKLRGSWHGEIQVSATVLTLVLRFAETSDGLVDASLDIPDQGAYGLRISDVELDDDQLSMAVPGLAATMSGTFSEGSYIGEWIRGRQRASFNVERGEYLGNRIDLPDEITKGLLGRWEATAGNTAMIFRFVRNDMGIPVAYLDVPSRRLRGLPLTDLSVEGETIRFIVQGVRGTFEGDWTADQISGEWTMPTLQMPLVINKSSGQ